MSQALRRMMNVTATVKRAALSGTDYGAPATHLTGVACTPIDPAPLSEQNELPTRSTLGSPARYYQTMVDGSLDIRAGDILVAGSTSYNIRRVDPWAASSGAYDDDYQMLTLEKVKP